MKRFIQDIQPLSKPGTSRTLPTEAANPPLKRTQVKPEKTVSGVSQEKKKSEPVSFSDTPLEQGVSFGDSGGRSKKRIWVIAGAAILIFLIALALSFRSATVTITPKSESVTLNHTFSAVRDAVSLGTLPFEVMSVEGEEKETVQTSEFKEVERRAEGEVTIFNENTGVQNLLIDTRLEAPDGKIYKTKKAVKVPGATKGGSTTTPGTISVGIYADEAGSSYNQDEPTEFKIFGFKGNPKYETVYARSDAPITGGATGQAYTIDPSERARVEQNLEEKLRESLLAKTKVNLPPGFVMFPDATFVSISPTTNPLESETQTLELSVEGRVTALIFDAKKLAISVAGRVLREYDGHPVMFGTLSDVTLTIASRASFNPETSQGVSFTLHGPTELVWEVDEMELAQSILGKKRRTFSRTLALFPEIKSAEAVVRPFWSQKFPDNISKITIVNTASLR